MRTLKDLAVGLTIILVVVVCPCVLFARYYDAPERQAERHEAQVQASQAAQASCRDRCWALGAPMYFSNRQGGSYEQCLCGGPTR